MAKKKSSLPSLKKESAVAEEKKEETQAQAAEETKSGETAAAEQSAPAAEEAVEAKAEEAPAEEAKAEESAAGESSEQATDAPAAEEAEAPAGAESASEEAAQAAEASAPAEETVSSGDGEEEDEESAAGASHEVAAEKPAAVAVRHEVGLVGEVDGYLAYFDYPDDLLHAADEAYKAGYRSFDAFSPFPIHGMDDAIGLGRSWLPWVTFGAGATGFTLANAMQFGMLTFDWPMIIGGKPYAPWPSFVPIMFELTVLIGGVTTALTMLVAAGCFRKPRILDPEFTNDRFALWISADDAKFDASAVQEFMAGLHPVEIKPVLKETV
jgi:hypothetical protein